MNETFQPYFAGPKDRSAKLKDIDSILSEVAVESKERGSSSRHRSFRRALSADMSSQGWIAREKPLRKKCSFYELYNNSDSEYDSFSYSSPLLAQAQPSFKGIAPNVGCDVFINHRGKDTKESVASLIYHNLHNKGCRVFLDKKSIQIGDNIAKSIKDAIRTASVHVVILSPNYAESEWCLDELLLILKSKAPVVPVFWEIKPSEIRMEDDEGVYARAFKMHYKAGKFNTRVLQKWKRALHKVTLMKGFIYEGDQGELLEKIAARATEYISIVKSESPAEEFQRATKQREECQL